MNDSDYISMLELFSTNFFLHMKNLITKQIVCNQQIAYYLFCYLHCIIIKINIVIICLFMISPVRNNNINYNTINGGWFELHSINAMTCAMQQPTA